MNEPESRRLYLPRVRRLALRSLDFSRVKHLDMACSNGTLKGEEVTLSFCELMAYLKGLIDFLLLSVAKGGLFLCLGVRFPFNFELVTELFQLENSCDTLLVLIFG